MTESFSTLRRRFIPRNISELVRTHGAVLSQLLTESGHRDKGPEVLAEELFRRDFLAQFPLDEFLPPIMKLPDVLAFLGASWVQWHHWHYNASKGQARHAEYLPKPVIGTAFSKKAEYDTRDILKLFRGPKQFSNATSVIPEETLRAFDEFVKATAERILYDWNPPKPAPKKMFTPKENTIPTRAKKPSGEVSFVGWPIGVPKNNDALYREYRVFVERTVLSYFKPCPGQQLEDIVQHVWMKLIESQTLEKFVRKARCRKIQPKITAAEAVEYLAITWDQWLILMRKELPWLQPVEGSSFSTSAIFTSKQIRNVEESGLFPIVDAIPAEDMTKVFRGYLRSAVRNHFANWVRTRVRRFIKDQVVPGNTRVVGGHFREALEGDLTSWEDSLPDQAEDSPEDYCDLPQASSVEELHRDLSEQISRIGRFVPSSRHEDVFALIADGSTLLEAISKVRATVSAEKVLVAVG
jgi:hypothetical protein